MSIPNHQGKYDGKAVIEPNGMIDHLKLRTPFFLKTATFGHFGRPEFTWEQLDARDELLAAVSKK